MHKSRCVPLAVTWLLGICLGFSVPGCSGCGRIKATTDPRGETNDLPTGKIAPLKVVADLAASTMESAKCQEAVKYLNDHLNNNTQARADLKKYQLDRELFGKQFALTKAEMDGLAGGNFTALDGYYLEWCFRLRDVALALKIEKLAKVKETAAGQLDRAKQAFAWVMRQVDLENVDEELLPPPMVLMRGSGTSQERALVFIDLLQQMELPGCIIGCPAKDSDKTQYWLAGVLIGEGKGDIFLFEPRLGLPVPGPGGKGIATLAQLLKEPELVKGLDAGASQEYDVTPDRAKKSEVLFANSMLALAPRMHWLQKQLSKHIHPRVSLDPAARLEQFAQADGKPTVQVWNQSGSDPKKLPATPLRALAAFLPPSAGGIGSEEKSIAFHDHLYPLATLKAGFRALKVYNELPPAAREKLLKLARNLLDLYVLMPHDRLTRGKLESMLGPLSRADDILKDYAQAEKGDVAQRVPQWRDKVADSYNKAEKSLQAKASLNGLWLDDPYLRLILEPGVEEKPIPRGTEKKILTYVVLQATSDVLNKNLFHLLALYYLEEAARLQKELDQHQADPTKSLTEQAKAEWNNALTWMEKYLELYDISPSAEKWTLHLQNLKQRWKQGPVDLGLLGDFFKDMHRGLALRLTQIDTLARTGQKEKAAASAKNLAEDVYKLRDNATLKEFLSQVKIRIEEAKLSEAKRDEFLKELARYKSSLEPGGSTAWIGQAAALRAK